MQSAIWISYQCQGAILEPLRDSDVQQVIPYKETISCGLFCLLYAYSIIHGVAMNFTQVDMPVFRKRMAFDILSGKATEPLGRERRGLEIIIQPKREKVWKKKIPLLDKVCRPFSNTSKIRVVQRDL